MDHTIASATPFVSPEVAAEVRERFGTPCYVYDRAALEAAARRGPGLPGALRLHRCATR